MLFSRYQSSQNKTYLFNLAYVPIYYKLNEYQSLKKTKLSISIDPLLILKLLTLCMPFKQNRI